MSTELASYSAMTLSFVALSLLTGIHLVPWLRVRPWRQALLPLLWVHAGRHVALQLFSSQSAGLEVSDAVRDQIVYGDLLGMLLALATIAALHWRWPHARSIAWLFVLVTFVDLSNALRGGITEQLLAKATDVSWLILNFYVPALWITLALIAWILTRAYDGSEAPRS